MAVMNARDALFNDIWDMRTTAQKNALIDAFAHELAEKQRAEQARCEAEQRSRFGHLDHECEMQGKAVRHMADFIDPLKGAT
jgi:hypothetical protein